VSNLLDKVTIARLFPEKDANDLCSDLNIFSYLNVNRRFFNVNDQGLVTIKSSDGEQNIPAENILTTAKQLNKLKCFENFGSFSKGFNNASQFSSTIFEVCCAYFALTHIAMKDMIFAPEVIVNGHIKRPDFAVTLTDDLSLICECKALDSINRAKKSRALRIMGILDSKLGQVLRSDFRVEIAFKGLPTHWNRNYADQLYGVISELIKRNFTANHIILNIGNRHKTWIKLSKADDPLFFQRTLNVGNKPKGDYPTLVIGELPNIKKDIKDAIRDAMTQIPKESSSLIFIYSLNEMYAAQAIREYYNANSPDKLLGVVSWTKDVHIHRNTRSKVNINNYLGFSLDRLKH